MKNKNVANLALLGMLTALIILLTFTPLGYLKTGLFSITFMAIPVGIGAAVLEKTHYGAILGLIWGLSSAFYGYTNGEGTFFISISVALYLTMCVGARVLAGLGGSLIHKLFFSGSKDNLMKTVDVGVTTLFVSIFNTIFFVGALLLFFGNNKFEDGNYLLINGVWGFITANVLVNGLVEMAAAVIIGMPVGCAIGAMRDKIAR